MAQAPAHRLGQIVGDLLEDALRPLLAQFAKKHKLYLDMKGVRPCRRGKKCAWTDLNGNSHDLDFVLERGGSLEAVGQPVAFIETAWRSYTKHSRNKAQEIQGAIEPLAATYQRLAPFKGAVLAGVFTEGAINQLQSLGFSVLHFPYESVLRAFQSHGVDIGFGERSTDREIQRKVKAVEKLSSERRSEIALSLIKAHSRGVKLFLTALSRSVLRRIDRIIVVVLHGEPFEVSNVVDAIQFINGYSASREPKPIHHIEVEIRYNNGNVISGRFNEQESAIEFLRGFEPPGAGIT